MKSLLILSSILLFMQSCSPLTRMTVIGTKHPSAGAKYCAVAFPISKSSAVTVTTTTSEEAIKGPVYFVDCDSAVKAINSMKEQSDMNAPLSTAYRVAVPCPDSKIITNTIQRDSIAEGENTAALQVEKDRGRVLDIDNAKLTQTNSEQKKALLSFKIVVAVLGLGCLLLLFLLIRK